MSGDIVPQEFDLHHELRAALIDDAWELRRAMIERGIAQSQPFNVTPFTENNADGITAIGCDANLVHQNSMKHPTGRASQVRKAPHQRLVEIDKVYLSGDEQVGRFYMSA